MKLFFSYEYEDGLFGLEVILVFELKIIVDVGLVGVLNVGKSILLGVILWVKFIVGYYVFIILRLNIGKLEYEDYFLFMVVDIFGLIKGVYENCGLGYVFLCYIEWMKVLVYVLDLLVDIEDNKGFLLWD